MAYSTTEYRRNLRDQAVKNGTCVNCLSRPATHFLLCGHCRAVKRNCDMTRQRADKLACLMYYGNAKCECCGESGQAFLTIDHINNDGYAQRRESKAHGGMIYSWLRRQGYPAGYRVLCANCNSGRGHGLCPHDPAYGKILDTRYKRYNRRIKIETLTHYSQNPPACACCGEDNLAFLNIDHLNGGGLAHRRSIRCTLYKDLRRKSYPDGFQVLCFNCNLAKSNLGSCPHHS